MGAGFVVVPALLPRLGTHASVNDTLLITFTVAAVIGAVAGSRVASRVRPERLSVAFALLMFAIAVYTAARSIPALA